jgi:hypothetical protein
MTRLVRLAGCVTRVTYQTRFFFFKKKKKKKKKKKNLTSFLFPSTPPPILLLLLLPFSSSSPCLSVTSSSFSSSKPHGLPNVSVSANSPRRSWSLSSSNSFKLRPWSSVPVPKSDRDTKSLEVRATSVPESAGKSAECNTAACPRRWRLGARGVVWALVPYLFNIYFNIYNKQVTFLMDFVI